ncbi:ABC transporter ATP-binding protein [Anaerorhabdus sp.]|uniref:ABC transporter ATP-binding protein n=1 Tax=Anaerorhabdus sp. TaxID=1872524 RepID=UPI002B1F7616|nr:ABC transporter ATP-binding protein [Anaerorhabdus sp.]MEA4875292.1 ABC transporter ATP-binding protein [Anaerorhabdus sp.]
MKKILFEQKSFLLFYALTSLFYAGFSIGASIVLIYLLNAVIARNIQLVTQYAIFCILCWIFALVSDFIKNHIGFRIVKNFNIKIKLSFTNKICNFLYSEFIKNEPNEYISWLINDSNLIEENGTKKFLEVIDSLFVLICSITALIQISWIVFVSAVLFFVLMIMIPNLFSKTLKKYGERLSKAQSRYIDKITNYINGFKEFYFANHIDTFLNLVNVENNTIESNKVKFNDMNNFVNAVIHAVSISAQIGLILICVFLAANNYVTPGVILGVGSLSGSLFMSMSSILQNISVINSVKSLVKKTEYELVSLDLDKQIVNFESLELNNISFCYENRCINYPSLKVNRGDKILIKGDSGAGKTTLIKIILGIYSNFEGEYLINNRLIDTMNNRTINMLFGYMNQDIYIFNDSIQNNITLFNNFDQIEIEKVLSIVNLNELSKANLNRMIGVSCKPLSGGEMQRIQLARILIQKNPILILDEATSALDVKNNYEIYKRLLANNNLTVLAIMHKITPEVKELFTKEYILDE